MSGNPEESKWYATPRVKRRRKPTELTLPEKTRKRLQKLATAAGVSKSVVVELLVNDATVEQVQEFVLGSEPSG